MQAHTYAYLIHQIIRSFHYNKVTHCELLFIAILAVNVRMTVWLFGNNFLFFAGEFGSVNHSFAQEFHLVKTVLYLFFLCMLYMYNIKVYSLENVVFSIKGTCRHDVFVNFRFIYFLHVLLKKNTQCWGDNSMRVFFCHKHKGCVDNSNRIWPPSFKLMYFSTRSFLFLQILFCRYFLYFCKIKDFHTQAFVKWALNLDSRGMYLWRKQTKDENEMKWKTNPLR